MKIVYVCSRGQRRSPVIAAYTKHFLRGINGLEDTTVGYMGVREINIRKDLKKNERRLEKIAEIKTTTADSSIIGEIRRANTLVHPRIAYLLLTEGVKEILEVPQFSPKACNGTDIVLALDESIRRQLQGDAQTVNEFVGMPNSFGIPDVKYKWFGANYQLNKDEELCTSLRGYATRVVEIMQNNIPPD